MLLCNEYTLASKYYEAYKNGLRERFGLEPDAAFKKLMHLSDMPHK